MNLIKKNRFYKKVSLYLMALLYVGAGINHFANPAVYLSIMPDWVPCHLFCVDFSGICEILFGLLLIPKRTRAAAAWLIVLLLIAVFPANIQMALDYRTAHNPALWIALLRLPLQVLLIGWARSFTRGARENAVPPTVPPESEERP